MSLQKHKKSFNGLLKSLGHLYFLVLKSGLIESVIKKSFRQTLDPISNVCKGWMISSSSSFSVSPVRAWSWGRGNLSESGCPRQQRTNTNTGQCIHKQMIYKWKLKQHINFSLSIDIYDIHNICCSSGTCNQPRSKHNTYLEAVLGWPVKRRCLTFFNTSA